MPSNICLEQNVLGENQFDESRVTTVLRVEDRDKIIKIQLSETNFVMATEQAGQQPNCLCMAEPQLRTMTCFIVLSTQGEQTALW